jgi:hypothetical protein
MMKRLSLALFLLALAASGTAFAQPAAIPSEGISSPMDAQAAFEKLKTLAGSWVGPVTVSPEAGDEHMKGLIAQLTLRVTSRGNSFVHEISVAGIPDHPVTMFYVDGDALYATHYCDAGNRPRLVGTMSADGNQLVFEFLDLSGSDEYGHMKRGVFTFIDENHHVEEWTFQMPNGEFTGRMDLQRLNAGDAASSAY